MQLPESTLENIEEVQGWAMKMIRGMEEGFKDQEYLVFIRDEYTRSVIIKLCRTINCTEKLSQTFLRVEIQQNWKAKMEN